ncbi:MAG TPA: hypothetical protein VH208_01360 [Myxococcaceae bacterium]|nr:hypothetical protein [Myxococcaceae bacterium]
MSDEKILALPAPDETSVAEGEEPVIRDPEGQDWRRGHCPHRYVMVHEEKGEVRCRECGALVDPFEFLMHWARRRESEIARLRKLEEEQAVYRTHALGVDSLTLCGLGPKTRGMAGRPWTLRLTNDRGRVNCHRCLDALGKSTVAVPLFEEPE